MLSTFTLIYIYTKASHTLKKWDFSSTLDRANHSVSAFFFCVVRAWRTCLVRRKIKYWSKFFGLSFKYLRDFSCGSYIMRQNIYRFLSFLSLWPDIRSPSSRINTYIIWFFSMLLHLSSQKIFWDTITNFCWSRKLHFEGYLNPLLKRSLYQQKEKGKLPFSQLA